MTRKVRSRKTTTVTDLTARPVTIQAPVPVPAGAPPTDAQLVTERDPIAEEFKRTDHDALRVLLDELAGATNARITVYRITKNQPQAYMFKCTPAEFSLDALRDKWGGGEFRLYIANGGQLIRNTVVMVEPKSSAEAIHGGGVDVAGILREGFMQQQTILQSLLALRPPAAAPAATTDLPALITAIGTVLAPLLTALVRPPAPVPGGGAERAIEMFVKGVEVAKDLGGGGGEGEPSLMGLLSSFLKSPMLATAVQGYLTGPGAASHSQPHRPALPHRPAASAPPLAQPKPSQAPAVAPIVAPGGAPHPHPNGPAMASIDPRMTQLIQQGLPYLYSKAIEGADPVLYAEWIIDNVPADLLQQLTQRPSAVDALIADYPPLGAVRDWVDALVFAVITPPEDEGAPIGEDALIDPVNGAGVSSAVSGRSPESAPDAAGSPPPVTAGRTAGN